MPVQPSDDRRLGLLGLGATAALLVPVALMAHECAHLAAGVLFGVAAPAVHYAGFTHGVTPGLLRGEAATIAAAGPAATLLLAVAGLAASKARGTALPHLIVVAACVRLTVLLPYAVPALARRLVGAANPPTTFDEDMAARLLGLWGDLSLIAYTGILSWILFWALWRQ